jgi:hypothetical protein
MEFMTSYTGAKRRALQAELPRDVVLSDSGTVDWNVGVGRMPGAHAEFRGSAH